MFRFCSSSRWMRLIVLGAFLCASASLGCGKKKATVSGTVSYKGERLGNGTVKFIGTDKQSAVSSIQPDGTYFMTDVPVGTVKIAVETIPTGDKPSSSGILGISPDMGDKFKKEAGKYVRIPDRYKDAEKSGLTYKVKPGRHKHNINLD